ncbi:MAG: PEP-CTERM sorting domain-containing protein [Candidatus Omnitrophica bacterium]|nr:PEP-CTERM sorting domain-containing protein [Candidatus Omnitrophota bacterium]
MSGAQSLTDGDASFAFSLEHNPAYPGYTLFGGIDFYNYASFGSFQVNEGDSVSFPDFSYAYNFLGSIDSTNDHLAFNTQVDLQYYFYPQDNTHDPIYGYFYSDYYEASNCPPGTECRTKWTYFNTPDASGNIQAAGNVTFANYNFTAPEPGSVQLVARWDFAAGAMNSIYGDAFDQDPPEPPTGVVPEPGTLSLLGLGLLGLVMRRKK